MNAFRFAGDMSHLAAIFILLAKIWKSRSCAGLSAKSQVLFLIVFVSRYLDLFMYYVSAYNTIMKITFISASLATVYLMLVKFAGTYERDTDQFRVYILLVPCAVLAMFINQANSTVEIIWTFSIYLEAVAIMPQLFMLQTTGSAETITAHYLFALGSYRALYLLNWVYRYYDEDFFEPVATAAGIVQTVLYADFFYLYFTRVIKARKAMELPI